MFFLLFQRQRNFKILTPWQQGEFKRVFGPDCIGAKMNKNRLLIGLSSFLTLLILCSTELEIRAQDSTIRYGTGCPGSRQKHQ